MSAFVPPERRNVIVTGASRGIGRAIAAGLAEHGFAVALVARDTKRLDELQTEILQHGGTALAVPADVTRIEEVEHIANTVHSEFGDIAIVINAAGIFGPLAPIATSDPQKWIETIQVNTIGPFLICRRFVGEMIVHGWGRIINLSSAASLAPPDSLNSAYQVSKVALNQLTRQLAVELEGTGVTANVIHPGEVKSDMWSEIRSAALAEPRAHGYLQWAQWVEETGGDPPHKALNLVLHLVSDSASNINGQFLWIDEGLQPPLPSW